MAPDPRPRYLTGHGLVEAPLQHCVDRLLDSGAGTADSLHATRGEAVAYLNALSHPEMRRVLFAVNDGWTAVVNNRRDGSDFDNDQSRFGSICEARTCRVVDRSDRVRSVGPYRVREEYPARIFDLAGPDGGTIRSVACALDGDRWVFETSGEPLPGEADFPYTARRKRDRFTSDHLRALVASVGADPPVDAAFATAERFVLTAIVRPGHREVEFLTPEEADDPASGYLRRGLGWVPYMTTHAESVVMDLTCAILLNPAREREARPHLNAARKQLGRKAFKRISAEAERQLREEG